MTMYPRLRIDLLKIRHNAALLVAAGRRQGIEIIGVTKGCLGDIAVAQAMVSSGVAGLADSRLANLERLRQRGFGGYLLLLRQPMLSEARLAVDTVDAALISETKPAALLARAALAQRRVFPVILMVETGGGREGVSRERLATTVAALLKLKGIRLAGVGTNAACLGRKSLDRSHLEMLVQAAELIESEFEHPVEVVSGGNSSTWERLDGEGFPDRINQLRFGEAALLGRETLGGRAIPLAFQDAFLLQAEVIEVKEAQSGPLFGLRQSRRVIVALGRQDVGGHDSLLRDLVEPFDFDGKPDRISSDHLIVDVFEAKVEVGEVVTFLPSYFALLAAMTSPYVQKEYVGAGSLGFGMMPGKEISPGAGATSGRRQGAFSRRHC